MNVLVAALIVLVIGACENSLIALTLCSRYFCIFVSASVFNEMGLRLHVVPLMYLVIMMYLFIVVFFQ